MKFFSKPTETFDPLQDAIDTLYSKLAGFQPNEEDYDNITDQIVKLKKLQHEVKPSWRPSPDVLVSAGVSVLTIVLILHYEKLNVVTSKALGFVGKMK